MQPNHSEFPPIMEIKDLSLPVHLGCELEERSNLQEVRFSLKIRFLETNVAEVTDHLNDTICYAEICETLSRMTSTQEFRLVEKLARESYQTLKKVLKKPARLEIRVHKVRPPVKNLQGGVIYKCGDIIE